MHRVWFQIEKFTSFAKTICSERERERERESYISLIVFLLSYGCSCSVLLCHFVTGTVGGPVKRGCGIS